MKEKNGSRVLAEGLLVGIAFFCLFLIVAIRQLDQPIAHVDEQGECQFVRIVEDNREKEIKCPSNWKDYPVTHVPSDAVLEEYLSNLSSEPETEILAQTKKELIKELKKRARIAQSD